MQTSQHAAFRLALFFFLSWQTEEEVGRQHQGMDRPRVRQVPEGSGEQGKMEKTGCKIICGDPTTIAVEGLMMMMMINTKSFSRSVVHFHSSVCIFVGKKNKINK